MDAHAVVYNWYQFVLSPSRIRCDKWYLYINSIAWVLCVTRFGPRVHARTSRDERVTDPGSTLLSFIDLTYFL